MTEEESAPRKTRKGKQVESESFVQEPITRSRVQDSQSSQVNIPIIPKKNVLKRRGSDSSLSDPDSDEEVEEDFGSACECGT